jgi:hypothetical protein
LEVGSFALDRLVPELAVKRRVLRKSGDAWIKGATVDMVQEGKVGFVDDRDGSVTPVSPSELLFRTRFAPDLPMGDAAEGLFDKPRRFLMRRALLDEADRVSRAVADVPALLGAKLLPVSHQIRAARTVVADPKPRYWIAFESGLGRRVTAGLIVRQRQDDGMGACLVLAPDHRVAMWRDEMRNRFGLQAPSFEVRGFSEPGGGDFDLLIVDEAQGMTPEAQAMADRIPGLLLLAPESAAGSALLEQVGDERVLRASRTEVEEALALGRLNPKSKLVVEGTYADSDSRVLAAIEDWRRGVRAAAEPTAELGAILGLFTSAAACWAGYVRVLAEARLGAAREDQIGHEDLAVLLKPELVPGEEERLRALAQVAAESEAPQEGDGLDVAADAILAAAEKGGRVVAFATEQYVVEELTARIRAKSSALPLRMHVAGQTPEENAASAHEALHGTETAVLLADRTGETGLRLQRATQVVLADVPWNPVRIERRLGQLDRVGRKHPMTIRAVVADEEGSLAGTWLEILRALGVFERPSVVPSKSVGELLAAAMDGERALAARISPVEAAVRDRVVPVEPEDPVAVQIAKDLVAAGEQWTRFQEAFEKWIGEVYGLTMRAPNERTTNYRWTPDSLISPDFFEEIRAHLRISGTGRRDFAGTFDRGLAALDPSRELFGPGHPVVRAMVEEARDRDLGRAIALKRKKANAAAQAGVYFRVQVSVEAADARRFPRRSLYVALDSAGKPIRDAATAGELRSAVEPGRDFDLKLKPGALRGACETIERKLPAMIVASPSIKNDWSEDLGDPIVTVDAVAVIALVD